MRTTIPIEVAVEVPTPTPSITMNISLSLPQEMPLMCDTKQAAKLFGLSPRTLSRLVRRHADFPVRRIGRNVRFLVPEMYAWFQAWKHEVIPVE